MNLRDFQNITAVPVDDSSSLRGLMTAQETVPRFTNGGSTLAIATPRQQREAQRIRQSVQQNVIVPVTNALTDPFYAATPGVDQRRQDARKRILEKVAAVVTDPMAATFAGVGAKPRMKLYRGDSVNADGIGQGSFGDLGSGHYLVDSPHVAEYFTDGSNAAHTRGFEVDPGNTFDLMDRGLKDNPRVISLVGDMPDGLNKTLVKRWLDNDLDVKDGYTFLANATGNTPETFNGVLAKYGFDSVATQGTRGVADGGKQYVIFDPSRLSPSK